MDDLQSYLDKALKQVNILYTDDDPIMDSYDIEADICKLIVATRASLGMTQKKLAEKSGISQANISKIENGNYRPSIFVLKRIADAFGKRLVVEFVDREEVI